MVNGGWSKLSALALAALMSACTDVASIENKDLAPQTEEALPPGSVMMEEGIYMVPVGEDEGTGCTMYTMVSRVPGKSVNAAIHWKTLDGKTLDTHISPGPGMWVSNVGSPRLVSGRVS